jgi:4-amino-4-deoxy-L-arabinose transferase-like glycosyltransferase
MVVEREWREASDMRRSTVSLAAILIVAAVLRFLALGSGIPYAIGVDEPQIVNRAVIMMRTGDFNPHFFDYPTLYIYVQLVVAAARFMTGAMSGQWASLGQVSSADFFLWARVVSASIGTLTVLLVHQVGMRWGTRPALLAAGLMAVMPLHVRESHYALTDVPLTFFVTLTFLLTLRAHEQPHARAFVLAGAAAGLAAATKYPGALAILLPVIAVWMTRSARPSQPAATTLAIAAGALTFLLAAPYTLLDLPAFLNGYARLASFYAPPPAEPGWIIYLKHLLNSIQWPAFLLVFGGAVFAVVRAIRGPGHVRWTLAFAFPTVYLIVISRQSGLIYGRYLLPILPFACILAATAVVSGVSLLRRFSIPRALRTLLIVGLTVATLLPSLITSIRFNRAIAKPSTAALAYDWLIHHVPKDADIVVECNDLVLGYSPLRSRIVRQLRQHDQEHYVKAGTQYLVGSSACYGQYLDKPEQSPAEYGDYMRLFEQNDEVARFSASPDHPGAEFRIFKVRR